MANELIMDENTTLSLYSKKKIEELIKPLKKEIFLTNSFIAGITKELSGVSEQEFFNEVSLNDELILQREPDGFSEDSIRVYSKNGVPLGFVADKDNEILARLMDAGKQIKAIVVNCQAETKEAGIRPYVNIAIYLVDF